MKIQKKDYFFDLFNNLRMNPKFSRSNRRGVKKADCISYYDINSSIIKKIDLNKCHDIKFNRSRKLCSYKGLNLLN